LSPINEDECVAEATNREAITKGNIYVNGVQIAIAGSIKEFTPLGFRDSGKRAKGGRELTAVNPFSISTHVYNIFVVAELPTSHDAMISSPDQ